MKRSRAEQLVTELNDVLKDKDFVEGVQCERFQRTLWELRRSGEWDVLLKDYKIKNGKPWFGVRLVSTDDPEYREIA